MKKTKKQQKIDDEKGQLRARLVDLLSGAAGMNVKELLEECDGAITMAVGLEDMARWLGAAMLTLTYQRHIDGAAKRVSYDEIPKDNSQPEKWEFCITQLGKFETLESAAEWLHEQGCRA
jgi:hypothetical protein